MIIGIDTGSSGAACVMDRRGGVVDCFDFSTGNARQFADFARANAEAHAVIETVRFRSGMHASISTVATQAAFFAGPQWVLDALGMESTLVEPREWQAIFPGLPHGNTREIYAARKRAIRDAVADMMRDRECSCRITLDRCDAIAIAEWGRLRWIG